MGLAGRAGRAGLAGVLLALASISLLAQNKEIDFSAVSANVNEPGTPVKIRLTRWSTEAERSPIIAALNPAPPAATGAVAGGGTNPANAPARGAAGRGGPGGQRGRGGRGRGGAPAAPLTPIAAFAAALGRAPTVGYIWTTDVTGYSIKYAYHASSPDGGERIVLATDRRLGAYSPGWKPQAAAVTDYDFTLVEIRLDARGSGEGKSSLTTKIVTDDEARTVALDDYAAAPVILEHVKR